MSEQHEKWRVGSKVRLNVYQGDVPICQCHTALDAKRIVDAVNATLPKPKLRILIAEAELPPGFMFEEGGVMILVHRCDLGSNLDMHRFPVSSLRIEDRDA